MSIHALSHKLALAGVKHVVVASPEYTPEADAKAAQLCRIKFALMVDKFAATDFENAERLAHDVLRVAKLARNEEDSQSYRAGCVDVFSKASAALLNHSIALHDKTFKSKYNDFLENPKSKASSMSWLSMSKYVANMIIDFQKIYDA